MNSTHAIAMRSFRAQHGLTQAEMAVRLGIGLPRYLTYENGRTKAIPPLVLAAMRRLEIDPHYSYVNAMYGGRSMREIALDWARRADVRANSPSELAAVLGVNKSTVSRWLNSSRPAIRPAAERFLVYERRIGAENAFLQSRKRRRA